MNPEKVTSSCYFENHWIKRLDYEAIICLRIKKKSAKKIVSMIGCMSHTEKAVSSCYIGSYWVVRFDCEDINCLEYKINWKKSLHHRMYESSRKRYIIMLSGKYRFSRLDNEDKSCLVPKKSWKKFTFDHRLCDLLRKSYIIMLSRKLLNFETWFWKQKLFAKKKKTAAKNFIFITVCMGHQEKATSFCYLANTRLLRLGY